MSWLRVGLIAWLSLIVGCTSTPPAAPTLAPVAPTAGPTANPTAATTVSGAIDTVNGRLLTITTNTGAKQVTVAEDARIEQEGKGSVSDLMPGLSVGVTGKPDGTNVTAVSIRIFPAAVGTPRPGQFPMTGTNQGNLMTNSVIESFDGSKLVLNTAGQKFEIGVPPGTEVLKPVPATLAMLTQGTRVLAMGAPAADGSLRATSINVMGLPPQ
jgi:hypothetical protein